jgi:hypothetical protein
MAAQLNAAAGEQLYLDQHEQVQEHESGEEAIELANHPEPLEEEHRPAPRLSS